MMALPGILYIKFCSIPWNICNWMICLCSKFGKKKYDITICWEIFNKLLIDFDLCQDARKYKFSRNSVHVRHYLHLEWNVCHTRIDEQFSKIVKLCSKHPKLALSPLKVGNRKWYFLVPHHTMYGELW